MPDSAAFALCKNIFANRLQFFARIAANLECFATHGWAAVCDAPELRSFYCDSLARVFQLHTLLAEQGWEVMDERTRDMLLRQLLSCASQALGYGARSRSL